MSLWALAAVIGLFRYDFAYWLRSILTFAVFLLLPEALLLLWDRHEK
jgi:hypothetical protein